MSAPLRLNAQDALAVSRFLDRVSAATRDTGVELCTGIGVQISVGDTLGMQIAWDDEDNEYVVQDRVGD